MCGRVLAMGILQRIFSAESETKSSESFKDAGPEPAGAGTEAAL